MESKIKILVVDDSLVFRHAVSDALTDEPTCEIVGSVRNGKLAIDFIANLRPDLVTLDLEMPELDGIETLKLIRKNNLINPALPRIEVLILSSYTQKGESRTVEALRLGAFDFITKPMGESAEENIVLLRSQLNEKLDCFKRIRASKHLLHNNGSTFNPESIPEERVENTINLNEYLIEQSKFNAVLIGVSTGGPRALTDMLPSLCQISTIPIFIVQHMPEEFTKSLAESLDRRCGYDVREAKNNEIVLSKTVYIAPGGHHMELKRIQKDVYIVVHDAPPEHGYRPSVDLLFKSASTCYPNSAIAVILTGMGNDGTSAVQDLVDARIPIIVQDEESSVVWGMPGSAVATGMVDSIHSLCDIPNEVQKILERNSDTGEI